MKLKELLADPAAREKFLDRLRQDIAETELSDEQIVQFRLNACREMRDAHSKLFRGMAEQVDKQRDQNRKRQLSPEANCAVDSDEFLLRVGTIVLDSKVYYEDWEPRVREFDRHCSAAVEALRKLCKSLERLPAGAFEDLRNTLEYLAQDRKEGLPDAFKLSHGLGAAVLFGSTAELNTLLSWVQIAIAARLGGRRVRGELKRAANRPPAPYLLPTLRLIEEWHALTGSRAYSPKQTSRAHRRGWDHKADQPSTEFVRLALLLIDRHLAAPDSAKRAVTAIRNALKAQGDMRGLLGDVVSV